MNRYPVLLLLLVFGSLSLSANPQFEPHARYKGVFALDKPKAMADNYWQLFASPMLQMSNADTQYQLQGHRLFMTKNEMRGSAITTTLQRPVLDPYYPDARWILLEHSKLPLTPAEQEMENIKKQRAEEDKARAQQKLAKENDPRPPVDSQGKPVYYAGSPEAEAQMRASAKEQDKAVAKFKQSGAPGNGPISGEGLIGKPVKNTGAFDEDDDNFAGSGAGKSKPAAKPADFPEEEEDKRPLSQRIMNTGKKPAPAAAVAPAAQADDEDERPVASGNKFAKPKTGQGTKKDDTLFKNQNQNNPPQHQAPNNFIGIWAYPKDRGKGDDDYRLVFVQLTGKDTPDLMSLKNAKRAGYVPESLRYTTLSLYPE